MNKQQTKQQIETLTLGFFQAVEKAYPSLGKVELQQLFFRMAGAFNPKDKQAAS